MMVAQLLQLHSTQCNVANVASSATEHHMDGAQHIDIII